MAGPTEPDAPRPPPPEAWASLIRLGALARRPLDRFLQIEAASGIALLVSAAIALAWANSPYASSYHALWDGPVGVRLGAFVFERPLAWVVNDVLMVVFFFVVGLEIRREIYCGELSELRRAALPAIAALGGMAAPAAIYLVIAGAPGTHAGWGVPTATDIAFAVGVLALLGKRVPAALRVLLLALAVIDDLGAIVVIAIFYSSGVVLASLGVAGLGLAGVLLLQRVGVRSKVAYVVPAAVVWGGVYAAGVHPTIAGVIVGLVTPVRAWLGVAGLRRELEGSLLHLDDSGTSLSQTLRQVELAHREARPPGEALVERLHPWVAFVIMPLFALANAGVSLDGIALDGSSAHVTLGVGLGLLVGKPIGILVACALSLHLGVALLPRGLTTRHLLVLGVCAGIGFTMALFVAQLAFSDPHLLGAAKVGILTGSLIAGVLGLVLGRVLLPIGSAEPGVAQTAHDAERSTEA